MPNIKSAKERVKLSAKQNLRNRMDKSTLKTAIKKFDGSIESGDAALVQENFKAAVIKLDKASAKGLIHKNTAARKKSQLARKVAGAAN